MQYYDTCNSKLNLRCVKPAFSQFWEAKRDPKTETSSTFEVNATVVIYSI